MKIRPLQCLLMAGFVVALLAAGCDRQSTTDVAEENKPDVAAELSDGPLAGYQGELLDVAFEAASKMPLFPHIKNRSRAQESVVDACLELDQPRRALGYTEKIDNWRRGMGYANLAFYCARYGHTVPVPHLLEQAALVAETTEDWRRDRVRVRVAQVHALLGQSRQAQEFEAGVVASEAGKVAGARAMTSDEQTFAQQMETIDAFAATGNFDTLRNAMDSATRLFDRFYDDTERRTQVEEKIKAFWNPLPLMIRIDLLTALAEFALAHGDQAKALTLVDEAQAILASADWTAESLIMLMTQLAELRARAGDPEKARTAVQAAREVFEAEKDRILDIHRADSLRRLAEAYQAMNDTSAALAAYKEAVEAGVVNPNSRPRAEDLSATCCSMALHEVEPDPELWRRIRQIGEGLSEPW